MSIRNLRWLPMAALTLSPVAGHAAMGQIATNFGLLPQDVASAQALSMFSNDPSVTYYTRPISPRTARAR